MTRQRYRPKHTITLDPESHIKGLELCHKLNKSFSGMVEKLITDAHRALIIK